MINTTRAQREALFRIFRRNFPSWVTPTLRLAIPAERIPLWKNPTVKEWEVYAKQNPDSFKHVPSIQYRRFLKTCQPEFCSHGAVMVPFAGMWIGVERDGYAHS